MNSLENEYRLLMKVLEESYSGASNVWQVCFHWWRYYLHLNQHVDAAKTIKEKVAIVEQYITQGRVLSKIEEEIVSHAQERSKQEVALLDPHDPKFPPYVQEMIHLMLKERGIWNKHIRLIKREKDRGKVRRKPPNRDRWLSL